MAMKRNNGKENNSKAVRTVMKKKKTKTNTDDEGQINNIRQIIRNIMPTQKEEEDTREGKQGSMRRHMKRM